MHSNVYLKDFMINIQIYASECKADQKVDINPN